MTNTRPGEKPSTGAPVHLKLQKNGFLDGERCSTLEMITTTDGSIDELIQHARKAAMRLIVPKSFPGDAGALVLRTDLQNSNLPNTHLVALAIAAGMICRRHARRNRTNRRTTVWACLAGWERNGATRVYGQRPQPLGSRQTATFLPAERPDPDGAGEAGNEQPART